MILAGPGGLAPPLASPTMPSEGSWGDRVPNQLTAWLPGSGQCNVACRGLRQPFSQSLWAYGAARPQIHGPLSLPRYVGLLLGCGKMHELGHPTGRFAEVGCRECSVTTSMEGPNSMKAGGGAYTAPGVIRSPTRPHFQRCSSLFTTGGTSPMPFRLVGMSLLRPLSAVTAQDGGVGSSR